MAFADCTDNVATLTPAQLCAGFVKCGNTGVRMNSAGFNAVIQNLEQQIIDAVAGADDKYLSGFGNYNDATNILTLAMSDGTTVDYTSLFAIVSAGSQARLEKAGF